MIKLPDLVIRDVIINPPIVQGGMGVRVSKSSLASAVSNAGALGVIASVGLGDEKESKISYEQSSCRALRDEIRKARAQTAGYLGVNIMNVLTNFDSLVKTAVDEKIDVIFSGAGLPLDLPSLVTDSGVKLVPIVSSARAIDILCKAWLRRYDRLPDAVVVEGPLAGGHLGFSFEELKNIDRFNLRDLFIEVKKIISEIERKSHRNIPIVVGGGVFTGKDIAQYLKLGADGVQMATRFICTVECDVDQRYKDEILRSKKEDIVIIKSPVGLPGRVISNNFVKRIISGEKIKFACPYKCLKTCEPSSVNYCIADALTNSSRSDFENGFVMCGSNAYRVNRMYTVKELIDELTKEAIIELT